MKNRAVFIWFAVMLCLIGTMSYFFIRSGGGENHGPRYTIEAFKRQWNVNAFNPKAQINQFIKTDTGYRVEYEDGLSLQLVLNKDIISSLHVRYEARPGQDASGQRFLHLMHTAINLGTFRWEPERITQVRQAFMHMTPAPKAYRYFFSLFTRKYEAENGWTFSLEFVPNTGDSPQ